MNKKVLYKSILIILQVILLTGLPAFSLELDLSVDEEIKKKYNTSQIENDVLPQLPEKLKNNNTTSGNSAVTPPPKTLPTFTNTTPVITKPDKKNAIKISKWTKFQVKSNQLISDWSKEGASIAFTTTAPVYKKDITIPSGTILRGKIINTHRPQITGNGGLIVLKITSITYNGKTYSTEAKVTKANSKKIFFNNIKGERRYWKNVASQVDKGENFYNKTRNVSSKMSDNPILLILSPVPTIIGVAGYALTTVTSPIFAIFDKGGNISIPSGKPFELKLLESTYVY